MCRVLWCGVLAIAVGCGVAGAGGSSQRLDPSSDAFAMADTKTPDAGYPGSAAEVSYDASLPPEQEKDYEFGSPEGSANFVFIPAAGTDTVIKVDGKTLEVAVIEVGDRPIALKVVPGKDAAVVLNAGSDDVSILWSDPDEVASVPVIPHCNAIAVSPSGGHAVAWYDHARARPGDPVGSFQAVSIVRLSRGAESAISVSTGFRPRSVSFTGDGSRAMVVTDDGVSVLVFGTLEGDEIVAPVPVAADPLDRPDEQEVLTTPDGAYAVVRSSGQAGLSIVDLESGDIHEVALTSVPTDLDLLPDGSAALAVLRESREAAVVPVPGAVDDPESVRVVSLGDLTAGLARITDDGRTAVLYTSVTGVEQVATLDFATLSVKPVLLRKTVDHVILPPGARKALLVHRPAPGAGGAKDEVEQMVDDSEGYTLFDLDSGFTKLVLTPVKPGEIAFSDAPRKGFLLLRDPAAVSHAVQEADLASFMTRDHPLGSAPEHVRVLAGAGAAAVTQYHPSGRITFIDVKTGEARTVTGFELNGLL